MVSGPRRHGRPTLLQRRGLDRAPHPRRRGTASFNTLTDGSTIYQADDEAWVYLGNTLVDLNPGDSIETAVAFDVPKGTDVESIELHDGPFSDGVVVGL